MHKFVHYSANLRECRMQSIRFRTEALWRQPLICDGKHVAFQNRLFYPTPIMQAENGGLTAKA